MTEKPPGICDEHGCGEEVHSRKKCQKHYRQLLRRERGLKPPGPEPDPSKPYSKHKVHEPKPREEVTHCPNNHPYDKENTYIDPSGYKHCKRCRRERKRKAGERHGTAS